jgi:hypothetical protein
MSLPLEFPGAETPWRSVPRTVPGGLDSPYENQANQEADNIADAVTQLRNQATNLSAQAEAFLEECRAFTLPPNVINYVQPVYNAAGFNTFIIPDTFPTVPDADDFDVDSASIDSDFDATFVDSPDAGTPPDTLPTIPDVPVTSFNGARPAEPPSQDIDIPSAPDFSYNLQPIPVPDALAAAPSSRLLYTIQTPQAISITPLSADEIDAAISRVRALVNERTAFSAYGEISPALFAYVSSLLESPSFFTEALNAANERRDAYASKINSDLHNTYRRRNIDLSIDFSTWLQEEERLDSARNAVSNTAALGRWNNDALFLAYQSAEKVHSQAMDLYGFVLSAEVDALLADAETQILWLEAAASAYEGAKARFEVAALASETAYAQTMARVSEYEAELLGVRAESDAYIAEARAFSAQERGKATQVNVSAALVDAEKAKAKAFDTQAKAIRARAEALEVSLAKYRGDVASWSAGVASAQSIWKEYSAKASAVTAENRAKAAKVQFSTAKNSSVVAETRLLAAQARQGISDFLVGSAKRRASLTEIGLKNDAVSKYMQAQSAQYAAELSSAKLYLLPEEARLEGVSTELAASSRYFVSAMEAAARAAEQAQNTNIQLAEAYNLVQKAAGEGAAAIEAGRLTALRAGVSVSAAGSIGASGTSSLGLSQSYSYSIDESQSASDSTEV